MDIPTTAVIRTMVIPADTPMIPATLTAKATTPVIPKRPLRRPAPSRINMATAIRRNSLIRSNSTISSSRILSSHSTRNPSSSTTLRTSSNPTTADNNVGVGGRLFRRLPLEENEILTKRSGRLLCLSGDLDWPRGASASKPPSTNPASTISDLSGIDWVIVGGGVHTTNCPCSASPDEHIRGERGPSTRFRFVSFSSCRGIRARPILIRAERTRPAPARPKDPAHR
jgi:hypothetical protein